jgi:hypothetical protein
MVPALITIGAALFGCVIALMLYIGRVYRESLNERMNTQDSALTELGKDMRAVKEMVASEMRSMARTLVDHGYRIQRLEDHNHLPSGRRYDDQDAGG